MRKEIVGMGTLLVIVGILLMGSCLIIVPYATTEPILVPKSLNVFNQSFNVPPNDVVFQSAILVSDWRIHIYFEVTSGDNSDISFFVADEVNYYKWKSGEPASVYLSSNGIATYDHNWTVPATDRWYFVYDNTFNMITPKSVTAEATAHWTETSYREVTRFHPLMPSAFTYVGVITLLVGAAILIGGVTIKESF